MVGTSYFERKKIGEYINDSVRNCSPTRSHKVPIYAFKQKLLNFFLSSIQFQREMRISPHFVAHFLSKRESKKFTSSFRRKVRNLRITWIFPCHLTVHHRNRKRIKNKTVTMPSPLAFCTKQKQIFEIYVFKQQRDLRKPLTKRASSCSISTFLLSVYYEYSFRE